METFKGKSHIFNRKYWIKKPLESTNFVEINLGKRKGIITQVRIYSREINLYELNVSNNEIHNTL